MLVKSIISLLFISSHLLSANNPDIFNHTFTPADCDIEFDHLFVSECDSMDMFQFSFSATSAQSSSGTYFLSRNDIIIMESIPYDSIITITLSSNAFERGILARDSANPECNDFYFFDDLECQEYNCELENAPLVFDCINDSLYQVTADVIYYGESDSLLLHFYSDESYFPIYTQLYAIGEFPVVLDTFSPSNTLYYFYITDPEDLFCSTGNEWNDAPDCMSGCQLSDLVVELRTCEDSTAFIDLSFEYDSIGEYGFHIRTKTQHFGYNFEYGEDYYTIGPLPADCETLHEISIVDNEHHACYISLTLDEALCCEEESCNIYEVYAEAHECQDSFIYVDIEFEVENPGSSGFEIRGNGVSYGDTFEYGQVFYTVGPLIADCETILEFIIIDNENPNCSNFFGFEEAICCDDQEECNISDIEIELLDCNEDGSYSLELSFDYQGIENEFFDIWADDDFIGFYRFDQLPITIDTFYPRDVEYDLIRICENDNPGCCAIHEFMGLDCQELIECNISEVYAEAHECQDSFIYVDIEFEIDNPGSSGFEIRGNGVSYGDTFSYGEIYYTVGPILADCETILEFIIIDNDNPNCSNFFGFEEAICCDDQEECNISGIVIELLDCNEDGSYSLELNFDYQGIENEFFDIWADDDFIGFFRFDQLPVTIDTFYPRDVEYDLIRICENDNPGCCAIHEFMGLDCEELLECKISEVYAEAHECQDSFIYVDIEFEIDNPGSSGFEIRGNGVSYGDTFSYGEIYYTVGPILADCETILEFIIIDNENPNCTNFFGFEEAICCEEDNACLISDIEIELGDCNSDLSYSLTLDFVYEGVENDFFDVWAGDEFIGFYRFDQLPVTIDSFYPRDVDYDLIKICENDNPDCCLVHEFMGPDCELLDSTAELDRTQFSIKRQGNNYFINNINGQAFNITIYNTLSQRLFKQAANSSYLVNTEDWTAGCYFLLIEFEGKFMIEKLIR